MAYGNHIDGHDNTYINTAGRKVMGIGPDGKYHVFKVDEDGVLLTASTGDPAKDAEFNNQWVMDSSTDPATMYWLQIEYDSDTETYTHTYYDKPNGTVQPTPANVEPVFQQFNSQNNDEWESATSTTVTDNTDLPAGRPITSADATWQEIFPAKNNRQYLQIQNQDKNGQNLAYRIGGNSPMILTPYGTVTFENNIVPTGKVEVYSDVAGVVFSATQDKN